MPKPIKKKVSKGDFGSEDSVRTFMSVAAEKVEANLRQVIIGAAAVLAVAVLVVGFFVYSGSTREKAEEAFYEGYKSYHGILDAKVLTPVERYEGALENFRKSYELKPSPQALLYLANTQEALGRHGEALASLKKLESSYAEDAVYAPLAIYRAALVHAKAGNSEEALKVLDRLYSLKSPLYKDAALAEAAKILEGTGKKDEAAKKYQSILDEFPDSPYAGEARFKLGIKDTKEQKVKEEAREEGGE